MFNENNNAVICSRVLEFSKSPASTARAPGRARTNPETSFFASSSFAQTRTSQSTSRDRSPSSSALTLLKADTTLTPFGTKLDTSSPAEPAQTPRVRVARPPTVVSRGTVRFTTMCPCLNDRLTVRRVSTSPPNGTDTTTMSAFDAASSLTSPETESDPVSLALFWAAVRARSRLRDPMITSWPCLAYLKARPKPSTPVPPSTAILYLIVESYSALGQECS